MRLYSKEQLHLGLSARRTGGGQRDQGSPVGESPSLEDGPGAGLSYEVDPTMTALDFGRAKSLEPAELREANVAIVDSSLRCFPGTSRSVETCS